MFLFSLARELKRTVAQLEQEMDAAEMMEWVAYFKATDENEAERLRAEIAKERTDEERAALMRAFLSSLKKTR